jgi:hypothetical protein
MMLITQPVYTEGIEPRAYDLSAALREFIQTEVFDIGIDWQHQYLWAKMTDQQCLMFLLKYPQYAERFQSV